MNVPQHPLVIRGAEMRAFQDAASILKQARQEAADEKVRERQLGYAEGLSEAAGAAASLLEGAAASIAAYWAQREQELVPLALAIAHRVLSELPSDDLLAGVARTAIAEHRQDAQLVLRAAPDAAAALRQRLSGDTALAHVHIQTDTDLAPGGCVLSHPQGRTRIGLLDQFRAMLSTAQAT